LAILAEGGDPDATAVVQTNAHSVGGVCAMLADTLALDRIVLGSLARYLGEPWLKKVRGVFAGEVLESVLQNCPIEPSILGDRLQDCSSLAAGSGAV
jgi:predicted NBD/HSP70 family sugar kinase